MVRVLKQGVMAKNIQVLGKTTKKMVMGRKCLEMDFDMKVNGRLEKEKEMALFIFPMDSNS